MNIDRMEAENMVMFPYQEPYAVTRSYPVGGTEQPKRINQRAENLKTGSPALQNTHSTGKQENSDHPGSPYRRPKSTGPQGRYRRGGGTKAAQPGNHRELPTKDHPLPLLGKTP